MEQQYVLSALVDNQPGVLLRVAGLFSRRGYNIDSLSVCETENKSYSRMTIVVSCESEFLDQIIAQLAKIIDVKKVALLPAEKSIFRELLIIKLNTQIISKKDILQLTDRYGGRVLDYSDKSVTIELTGETTEISDFINCFEISGIIELVRTGITALQRGDKSISNGCIS